MAAHLRGFRDEFPALAMSVAQADTLHDVCLKATKMKESKKYTNVHAIYGLVLDTWAIAGGIAECYYKPNLSSGYPQSKEELHGHGGKFRDTKLMGTHQPCAWQVFHLHRRRQKRE